MKTLRSYILVLSTSLAAAGVVAQEVPAGELLYMGHKLEVFSGEILPDGGTGVNPARLCFESSEECIFTPEHYGLDPKAEVIDLGADRTAILFSAVASGGGSGQTRTLLVLVLDVINNGFVDLSPAIQVSEQGEYAIWHDRTLPSGVLFVTADYIWGEGERHFSDHRFRVRSYVLETTDDAESIRLALRDEYETANRYPNLDRVNAVNVLDPERQTIIGRLAQ